MVVKTITVVDGVTYLLNRVPFGVHPGSFLFSGVSEPIFDMTTNLLQDPTWYSILLHNDTIQESFGPIVPIVVCLHVYPLMHLLVDTPKQEAFADGFIHDIMLIGLGSQSLWGLNASPLASHAVFHPPGETEYVSRSNVSSLKKLATEGFPATYKILLGWLIDTHLFSIKLERKMLNCWSGQSRELLQSSKVHDRPLESLIRKLTHASYIVLMSHYFLNRLWWLLKRCKKWGCQRLYISEKVDLKLWL